MEADSVTLDKDTFKALASETRVHILKSLDMRRKTASELSKELGTTVQGISEHLHSLQQAGLVERQESGRKWVYYNLTVKGSAVLHPDTKKFWVLVALSFLALASYYNSPLLAGFSGNAFAYQDQRAMTSSDTGPEANRMVATPEAFAAAAAPAATPAEAQDTQARGAQAGQALKASAQELDNSTGTGTFAANDATPTASEQEKVQARQAYAKASAISQIEVLSLVAAALLLAGAGWIKFVKRSA